MHAEENLTLCLHPYFNCQKWATKEPCLTKVAFMQNSWAVITYFSAFCDPQFPLAAEHTAGV